MLNNSYIMKLIEIQKLSNDCFGKEVTILLKSAIEVKGLLIGRKIQGKLSDGKEIHHLISLTVKTEIEEMEIKIDSIDSVIAC